jgi:hypothetical protein
MSNVKEKSIKQAKKQIYSLHRKISEILPGEAQTLDLLGKDFKLAHTHTYTHPHGLHI